MPRRLWRRWLWFSVLAVFGLGVGFAVPYFWVLDREVRSQFGALQWQEPSRVYARPLLLAPGLRMNAQALELELMAAGYRVQAGAPVAGSYAIDGNQVLIHTRDFSDIDGPVPGQLARFRLVGGAVANLTDASGKRGLPQLRVDPARIATLYGAKREERRLVRLQDVPELLVTGLQAVEDRDFKFHRGVDPLGILRAAWVNLRSGQLRQGGSTLTQQLVRSLFLSNEQTFSRKLNEAAYALIIEARFDKRVILEAYLNDVYLGQQGNQAVRGVGAAAEFWFGRELDRLDTPELALLIGLIQGPSYHDPRRHPERARARRAVVLKMMADTGLIDDNERERAQNAPLGVSANPGFAANRYPAFMDLVYAQLARDYPPDTLTGAGLSIHTTLAPSAQDYLEQAVASTLPKLERKGRPQLQVGAVVTDANDGAVLAMLGNRQFTQPGFNRALDAQRPVGSLLKPFVYMLALAQPGRYALASFIEDAPIVVELARRKTWSPANIDGVSHGRVRLIEGLAQSYNQATVRLGLDVGVDRLSQLLKALANITVEPNPSLLLGSIDLSPLRVAQAYQFLASAGQVQPLHALRAVLATDGAALHRYDVNAAPAQRGDDIATRLAGIALQHTVTDGTARQLVNDGLGYLRAAGKTGTSNDSRDSWFAGYTGSHLAVIWVGNDQNQPTGLYGSTGAMRVWSALFRKLPSKPLTVSNDGLQWVWVDDDEFARTDPGCAGAKQYPFVEGFAPEEFRGCVLETVREWFSGEQEDGR
ncbi:MAG: penicillin-binding protein 1B [Gammaproteobacteria bacterium HGW-Gammaproteobacteria-2]|jgi:penicillin-binding protein 1B|nr:MAG: penicillin-binding protein 1B [Gammaproteobacteria bacterium HGW-Gammaproteobacteria-2]